MTPPQLVFDTTTPVSAALFAGSVPDRALRHALGAGRLLLSTETLAEAAEVFRRPKFGRYLSIALRDEFLDALVTRATWVDVTTEVRACRDSQDDRFLALAIDGDADAIVSGDRDLLVLHPFRGVTIQTAAAFLAEHARAGS